MKNFSLPTFTVLVALMFGLSSASAQVQSSTNAPLSQAGWIQILTSSSDLKAKVDACQELSRVGTEVAVPALAALLVDDQLSHSARYALETIPGKAPDRALREALKTAQGRNLVGIIGSLGVRRDESAVSPLKGLLTSSNPEVVQAAARALGKIGGGKAVTALEKAYAGTVAANQPAFWEGLLRGADHFLADEKESKAAGIYEWLAKLGGPHQLKSAALRGRVLSQPKTAPRILEGALSSGDYILFATACRISHEVTNAPVTRVLIQAMEKAAGDRQVLLIQTLGIRHDLGAVGALGAAAARPENREARLAALRALGQMASPSALTFLAAFISDTDVELARTARESLVATPSPEVEAMIQRMLTDKNPAAVSLGLELAARRRAMGAYEQLLRIARGSDASLRLSAIKKLAELTPSDDSSEPMKIFLQTTVPAELEAAEQTLTTLSLRAKNREAAAALVSGAWTLGGVPQQKSMLNILAAIGGTNALNAVRVAVGSTLPEVRAAAIRALGAWTSLDAAPDLLKLAGSSADATEKMLSLRSYMNLVTESDLKPEQRLDLCRQAQSLAQQPDEKKLLLSVLGGINSPQALELVRPHLGDTAVAEEAQNAVLRIVDKALQAKDPEPGSDLVLPCLEHTAKDASNPALKSRAEDLLTKARAKAEKK